jgi:hypothetical protein
LNVGEGGYPCKGVFFTGVVVGVVDSVGRGGTMGVEDAGGMNVD